VSRRPIIFLIAVNVTFNLISKLPVHTAKILQNRYLILNVYAKVLKACVHLEKLFKIDLRIKIVASAG
jgi:hypothetical protein